MSSKINLCTLIVLALVAVGCSQPAGQPQPSTSPAEPSTAAPAPSEPTPANVTVPTEDATEAPAADSSAEPAPAEPAADMPAGGETKTSNVLVGTTWQVGEYTLTFKEEPVVLIKGGQVDAIAPDGLEGEYKLSGSTIEIGAMGDMRAGTFDGTTISIDGQEGKKVEATDAAPAEPAPAPDASAPADAAPAEPTGEPAATEGSGA